MVGIWGFDRVTGKYWYTISRVGVEVEAGDNLTKKELEEVRYRCRFMKWHRDL